uniref:Peptidase S1 domain-containing protein n=1 Tax=Timema genevievae TaxID=629358 RepID=A0A7R9K0I5_TIMGE|nr:unnamed protein product [Timema genevievae]
MAGLSAIEPKKVDQIIQSPRIFGGVRAKKGEYPFTVWIKSSINKCTGSILSQYWVLYAAHCAFKAPVESIIVIAGIIVYNPSSDDGQKRHVREIVFYPAYLGLGGYRYDMALLRVKEPFDMNQEVNTVAIAVSPFPRTAQLCTAIGFGKTEIYDETPTQKWVNLIVENPRICFTAHPEDDYHICGRGQTGKQPCIGDSGGPLICQDVLVGVTSFGVNKRGSTLDCDEPGNIIVFAFTGYYEDWIRSHVTDLRAPVKLSRSHHLKFELGYVGLVISRGPGFQIFDEALGLERAQISRNVIVLMDGSIDAMRILKDECEKRQFHLQILYIVIDFEQALYECIVSTFPHEFIQINENCQIGAHYAEVLRGEVNISHYGREDEGSEADFSLNGPVFESVSSDSRSSRAFNGRATGIDAQLEKSGYNVELVPSVHLSHVEIEAKGRTVFQCNIQFLEFNGDGEDDPLCRQAVQEVDDLYSRIAGRRPKVEPRAEVMSWRETEVENGSDTVEVARSASKQVEGSEDETCEGSDTENEIS